MKRSATGYTLMEVLIALALGLTVLGTALALSRTGYAKVDAASAVTDTGRIVAETRRLFLGLDQAGYTGLTPTTLRAAGADLEDLWVPASSSYRASAGLVNVLASDRVPGGTGAAGDGFQVQAGGMKPNMCEALVARFAAEAVYITATNTAGATVQVTGVPGTPTASTVAAACRRPPAVTVALHFN